jgi:hypothetical protein
LLLVACVLLLLLKWPAQGSGLESPAPEAGAASTRPAGQIAALLGALRGHGLQVGATQAARASWPQTPQGLGHPRCSPIWLVALAV